MNSHHYVWHRLQSPEAAEGSMERRLRRTSQSRQMYQCGSLKQNLQPPEGRSIKWQFVWKNSDTLYYPESLCFQTQAPFLPLFFSQSQLDTAATLKGMSGIRTVSV